MSVNEKMTAIADTIRSFTGKPGKLGLDDMPGAINEAVEANGYEEGYQNGYDEGEENGYINGYADGNDDGIEEGKQAEYDRFWDSFQQNGNRTDYQNCFSGEGWTEELFKPKYDIVSSSGYMIFRRCGFKDLGEAIRNSEKRVAINNNFAQFTFQQSQKLEVIDGIEFSVPLIYIGGAFDYCNKLRKIQTLPISENATTLEFTNIPALEEISFSGVLPVSLSFQQSKKLNRASIESIVEHLSSAATGKTLTLSKKAVEAAFGSTTAAEWTALAGTKPNWTISLV